MLLALALVLLAIPPPVVQYLFQDGQSSLAAPSTALDSAAPSRVGPLTTSTTTLRWAADRQGAEVFALGGGFRAASAASSSSLLPFIDSEFTLKLACHVTTMPPAGQTILVAGFGSFPPGAAYTPCDPSNASDGGLHIVIANGAIFLQVIMQNSAGDLQCRSIVRPVSVGVESVFVFRVEANMIRATSTSMFIGISPLPGFSLKATRWNPHPLVFASPHVTTGFLGFIREFSMYNVTMTNAEALTLVSAAPPNSAPYGTLASPFSVMEDIRTVVPLTCTDFDSDAFTIALTDLPTGGSMYFESSLVPVTRAELPLIVNATNLFYQTAPDDVLSAQFRYRCMDLRGAIGRESTISITVTPVNDPPRPANVTTASVGRTLVRLPGSDVERNPFERTRITSLPRISGATLRRVNPNGTPGAPIALGEVVSLDVFYEPPQA